MTWQIKSTRALSGGALFGHKADNAIAAWVTIYPVPGSYFAQSNIQSRRRLQFKFNIQLTESIKLKVNKGTNPVKQNDFFSYVDHNYFRFQSLVVL